MHVPLTYLTCMQVHPSWQRDGAVRSKQNSQLCLRVFTAAMQVPTILAVLLGRFQVGLAPQMGGYEGVLARQLNAFTLSLKGGCHLRFTPR